MICVACDQRDTFENVETWVTEIRIQKPTHPILLVLTKSDQAKYTDNSVKLDQLKEMSQQLGCTDAVKVNAKKQPDDLNVSIAVKYAIESALIYKRKGSDKPKTPL